MTTAQQGNGRTGRRARYAAALAAVALLAASCGGEEAAEVRAEPAGQEVNESISDNSEPNDSGVDSSQSDSSESDGSDSDDFDSDAEQAATGGTQTSSLGAGIEIQRFTVPHVPPIALPDLSVLSETGSIVEQALGSFAEPESGLEVVSAECAAEGGELVYNGSDTAGSFLDVDGAAADVLVESDGSGVYNSVESGVNVVVQPDGSGVYSNVEDGVDIVVESDGSGTYSSINDGVVNIAVEADGSGTYSSTRDSVVNITIESDGSGSFSSTKDGVVNIDVAADGSGSFSSTKDSVVNVDVGADGSAYYKSTRDGVVTIVVEADGSGTYNSTRDGVVNITVAPDGSGTYRSVSDGVDTTFTTDIGILDPQLLVLSPEPVFAVADRFPPLAKMGALRPPCVTIVRLDASVLFDFDSDQLRPEASAVVANVASALVANGKALEVHGHTDSKGDDAYNQDLSERRATSFAAALVAQGVSTDISTAGFGESRPAAPNETAEGADDPAGRQLNRRIEIVIPE